MKKLSQRIYSKFLSISLAISGVFSFSANAEPFPYGKHQIYSVAVVGSRFDGDDPVPIEYRKGLNQEVIDNHCKYGTRVTGFDGVERHSDGNLWLGDVEISEDTILTEGDIFSFYDFSKMEYDLNGFQFAICPFETNPDESMDELKERMTKLTVYLKGQNKMLDIAFMPIIDDSKHDEDTVFKFGQSLEKFAYGELNHKYMCCRQDLNTCKVLNSHPDEYYENHLNMMLHWSLARREDYKDIIGNDVPYFDLMEFKREKEKSKKINTTVAVTIPVVIIAAATLSAVLLKKNHVSKT